MQTMSMEKKPVSDAAIVPDTAPATNEDVFAVNLSTLQLSGEAKARIGAKLSRAVLDELATLDFGSDLVVVGPFRRDWYGGMRIRRLSKETQKALAADIQEMIAMQEKLSR